MLMPYQVTLVPNYLVSDWMNLLDTRWAIWLPGIFSPFAVFLLTKFMRRIPAGVIEAAEIDGAGEFQIFTMISLPLCKSAVCSAAILVFIDYWNMVEQPIAYLKDFEKYPISVALAYVSNANPIVQFVCCILVMIPPLFLFMCFNKELVQGIIFSEER